jgi:hypothetical protein
MLMSIYFKVKGERDVKLLLIINKTCETLLMIINITNQSLEKAKIKICALCIAGHRHRGRWRRRRHPVSQSSTGEFRHRTGSPYSGTGLVPASAFCSFRHWTDRMPDRPAFQHFTNNFTKVKRNAYVHAASDGL